MLGFCTIPSWGFPSRPYPDFKDHRTQLPDKSNWRLVRRLYSEYEEKVFARRPSSICDFK
jgi:hypothetical protein